MILLLNQLILLLSLILSCLTLGEVVGAFPLINYFVYLRLVIRRCSDFNLCYLWYDLWTFNDIVPLFKFKFVCIKL